jgi:hypothetical protein
MHTAVGVHSLGAGTRLGYRDRADRTNGLPDRTSLEEIPPEHRGGGRRAHAARVGPIRGPVWVGPPQMVAAAPSCQARRKRTMFWARLTWPYRKRLRRRTASALAPLRWWAANSLPRVVAAATWVATSQRPGFCTLPSGDKRRTPRPKVCLGPLPAWPKEAAGHKPVDWCTPSRTHSQPADIVRAPLRVGPFSWYLLVHA